MIQITAEIMIQISTLTETYKIHTKIFERYNLADVIIFSIPIGNMDDGTATA